MNNKVLNGLMGLCVGDALGVPVEFKSREYLRDNPVKDMIGYGTHSQPPGTWSDDSSLTLCLTESLCLGYNLDDIADKFIKWYKYNHLTPHGEVFDIGIATSKAIKKLQNGILPSQAGGSGEFDNGNGSLMRILPLAYILTDSQPKIKYNIIKEVSSITHKHSRSILACCIYIDFAVNLIKGNSKIEAYNNTKNSILNYFKTSEIFFFDRVLNKDISSFQENQIKSSGYVVDTLEAALWCFFKYDTYEEIVLKAVNLGDDTDTTAAVAGGLAGIYYGYDNIPVKWIEKIIKKDKIVNLAKKLNDKIMNI